MQVLTSNLENFGKLYDQIGKPAAEKLLINNYIMKGSQGLRTFFWILSNTKKSNARWQQTAHQKNVTGENNTSLPSNPMDINMLALIGGNGK